MSAGIRASFPLSRPAYTCDLGRKYAYAPTTSTTTSIFSSDFAFTSVTPIGVAKRYQVEDHLSSRIPFPIS
ncbi:unnamed protein product [Protopolystoma xenopodis]|uniref:Uncharacterized protein n=1 Tax=Protopolystoma xenopodis TaxID=117903 RepID=A0A3S5AZV3_9PLAT|nr:unnamed protein product [Protopolystoma xenopodis]